MPMISPRSVNTGTPLMCFFTNMVAISGIDVSGPTVTTSRVMMSCAFTVFLSANFGPDDEDRLPSCLVLRSRQLALSLRSRGPLMPGPPNLGIEGPSAFPRRVRLRLYKGTKPPLSLPDVALPARPSCPAPPTLTSTNVVPLWTEGSTAASARG
jgi:hypothetical protein